MKFFFAVSSVVPGFDPTSVMSSALGAVATFIGANIPSILGIAVIYWMVEKGAKMFHDGTRVHQDRNRYAVDNFRAELRGADLLDELQGNHETNVDWGAVGEAAFERGEPGFDNWEELWEERENA